MDRLIMAALTKRWGEVGVERGPLVEESFPDVNAEAIARALLSYRGNYPPYPKDIETKVYQLDIDGVFMRAVRDGKLTREEHLSRIRKRLMEDIR